MSETSANRTLYPRESVEFARAFTFFDAVYAFALTLLVVNLDPPSASDWRSFGVWFGSIGWQLFGFAVSFVVIATFWRTNHRIASGFTAMSPGIISANLVALAFVVLIPFSTQGVSDPGSSEEPLAVTVYSVNIAAAVLTQSTVFGVARRSGLIAHPSPAGVYRARFVDTLVTPVVFLAAIPVAYLVGAEPGKLVWASLLVISPVSGQIARRRTARIVAAAAQADASEADGSRPDASEANAPEADAPPPDAAGGPSASP